MPTGFGGGVAGTRPEAIKRLLADAELKRTPCESDREGRILGPSVKRRAARMIQKVKGISERFACKVVGLCRSRYRRRLAAQTPDDLETSLWGVGALVCDAEPVSLVRRVWAALRLRRGQLDE